MFITGKMPLFYFWIIPNTSINCLDEHQASVNIYIFLSGEKNEEKHPLCSAYAPFN